MYLKRFRNLFNELKNDRIFENCPQGSVCYDWRSTFCFVQPFDLLYPDKLNTLSELSVGKSVSNGGKWKTAEKKDIVTCVQNLQRWKLKSWWLLLYMKISNIGMNFDSTKIENFTTSKLLHTEYPSVSETPSHLHAHNNIAQYLPRNNWKIFTSQCFSSMSMKLQS